MSPAMIAKSCKRPVMWADAFGEVSAQTSACTLPSKILVLRYDGQIGAKHLERALKLVPGKASSAVIGILGSDEALCCL